MTIKEQIITAISFFKHPQKRKLIKACSLFRNKAGLEIGGPSSFFSLKGYFPVYLYIKSLDGLNFNHQTIWEGEIKEGPGYTYYNKTGYQFIKEASDLTGIHNDAYDFLLSCHSLEHVANPIKALQEWNRVIKKNGLLLLVLPDKNFTFDKNRNYTSFEHLLEDAANNVNEYDTTHFEEVINSNPDAENAEKRQCLLDEIKNNFQNRYVHHHVFSLDVIEKMLVHTGFEVLFQKEVSPFHLVTVAQKK